MSAADGNPSGGSDESPDSSRSESPMSMPDGVAIEDFAALLNKPESILLIDARPQSDYLVSHIKYALSVRLSSLMTRRLAKGTNQLYDLVIQEQKAQYKETYEREDCNVIVYDSKCPSDSMDEYDGKNPLHVILRSLVRTKKKCCYLCGGFDAFREKYADLVSVPDVVYNPAAPFPSLNNLNEPLTAAIASAGIALSPGMPVVPSPFAATDNQTQKILNIAASEILPFLMVGSRRDAADREVLRKNGVTHVLNSTPDCPCHFKDELVYLRIAVKDCWNQDLPSHFDDAFKFINSCKDAGGKAMIHCNAGISRSATLAIAYIMATEKKNLMDAYTFVKSKRPVISPNLDFMGELQQYEKTLGISEEHQTPLPVLEAIAELQP